MEDYCGPEDDFSTDNEEYQPESFSTAQTLLSGYVVADSDDSDSDSLPGGAADEEPIASEELRAVPGTRYVSKDGEEHWVTSINISYNFSSGMAAKYNKENSRTHRLC